MNTSMNTQALQQLETRLAESINHFGDVVGKSEKVATKFGNFLQKRDGFFIPSLDIAARFKKSQRFVFNLYPEIERKILYKNLNFSFKGQKDVPVPSSVDAPGDWQLLREDKERFKANLEELNKLIIDLDESSNFAVIQHIHEALFDMGRNIERKLKLFRQIASKKELQKMFKVEG